MEEEARAEEMVRLERCAKSYGGVTALSAVDLVIGKGEFVTLLGPSGSGKSTILNLIAGMSEPSSGRVLIAGRDAAGLPPGDRNIGMVFQNYALMPHMSVFDNIAFPLRVRRVPRNEIKRRVANVLEQVQLPHVAGRKPRELSGGQQQRISLARCIVYNPDIILMDEPLGALDKKLREDMQLEIKRLHRDLGITVLYVTHDQEEALTMSDRIVLLRNGRVEQEGTPNELYHRPCNAFVATFLGISNLLDGVIEAVGRPMRVETCDGVLLAAEPGNVLAAGTRVRIVIRPECIRTAAAEVSGATTIENAVQGTVEETLTLGAFTRYYVRSQAGALLVTLEFNRPGAPRFETGERVRLSWGAGDTRILAASDNNDGGERDR